MKVGEKHLIRLSAVGPIYEVEILNISPSCKYVQLSDLGWKPLSDLWPVERLVPAVSVTEGQ